MKAKRILASLLCALMIVSTVLSTGCSTSNSEENAANTTSTRKIVTLNMYVITNKETDKDMARQVQMEINQILLPNYKTMLKINYINEDEYWDTMDGVMSDVAYYRENGTTAADDAAKAEADAAKSDNTEGADASATAENAEGAEGSVKTDGAESTDSAATTEPAAETTTTTDGAEASDGTATDGTAQLDENGNPVEEVPLESDGSVKGTKDMTFNELIDFIFDSEDISLTHPQLDIFVCNDYDRYCDMADNGELVEMDSYISYDSKVLTKYVYPTFLSVAKLGKSTYGIPTNYGLSGDLTYLVYNKDLLDKYGYKVSDLTDYTKMGDYLSLIKNNEPGIIPISEAVPVSGAEIYNDSFLTISRQFNIVGNSTLPTFMEPNYTANLKATQNYRNAGYIANSKSAGQKYAVEVVKSPDLLDHEWNENGTNYEAYLYDVAHITSRDAFKSAMCISSLSTNKDRAMELITLFNTNSELANLLQYGISGTNYYYDADTGSISMLNDSYSMNTYYTGNTYIKYPLAGEEDYVENSKKSNLSTAPSAFLGFHPTFTDIGDQSTYECTKTICQKALEMIENGADVDATVIKAKRELVAIGCVYTGPVELGGIYGQLQNTQAATAKEIQKTIGLADDVLHFNDYYGIKLEEVVVEDPTPAVDETAEGDATEEGAEADGTEADPTSDAEVDPTAGAEE